MQTSRGQNLAAFLALNKTVGVVLIAVLFFGLGEEMWSPFMGIYLDAQTVVARSGDRATAESSGDGATTGSSDLSHSVTWAALLAIGIYAFLRNAFEGFCYIGGGQLTHRLGDKGSLILFALLTITGYVLFLAIPSTVGSVIAAILILGWEPLSVPVTFTTVGSTVSSSGRGMAFALQSIQKRLPKVIGPVVAGYVLGIAHKYWGDPVASQIAGMRVLVGCALVMGAISLAVQFRWMPHRPPPLAGPSSLTILRNLHPFLRRLLVAEVFTRWCDWLVPNSLSSTSCWSGA